MSNLKCNQPPYPDRTTSSRIKLLVITVNYTTAKYVLQGLKKFVPQLEKIGNAQMWIVDNNSPDDSVRVLRDGITALGFEHIVRIIESPVNNGFGAGNNIAFREALALPEPPSYFYLLNPDAIPDPGTVNTLINFIVAHPNVGVVGGALRDEQGNLQSSAFRFPSLFSEIEGTLKLGIITKLLHNHRIFLDTPKQATSVDWVSGASMIIRRDVIEQVGMFDETFFLYWEELDLCRRVRDAGYDIYFVPNAMVWHISGVTTGMSSHKRRVQKYWFDSRAYYIRKTLGSSKLMMFNLASVFCISLHRVRQYLGGKTELNSPYFLRDFVRYNFLPRHQEHSRSSSHLLNMKASTIAMNAKIYKRPHYKLNGDQLFFLKSKRPMKQFSAHELAVWEALDKEHSIDAMRYAPASSVRPMKPLRSSAREDYVTSYLFSRQDGAVYSFLSPIAMTLL